MKIVIFAAGLITVSGQAALAEFAAGTKVYAAPTGGGDWYSGCTVGDGRSNNSYQVKCAGTTWWISAERISTEAPKPQPDSMRPGQMAHLVITPSDPPKQKPAGAKAIGGAQAAKASIGPGSYGHDIPGAPGPGNYAGAMAAHIAADNKAAASVLVLKPGTYTCYAGGQYTFTDLIIKSPTSYSDSNGKAGSYSIAKGALTFTSGPYKGAYSRMVDGHTIGLSAPGSTNLGTQCGFDK